MQKRWTKRIALLLGICLCFFTVCGCNKNRTSYEVTLSDSALAVELWDETTLTASVTNGGKAEWTATGSAVEIIPTENVCRVRAVAAGEAVVSAKIGGVSASCTVTVAQNDLIPLLVLDEFDGQTGSLGLRAGDVFTLTPKVLYNGQPQSDFTVSYATARSDVLSVDANGVITAKKEGDDEITVTGAWRGYDAVSLTASVAVHVFGTQAIVLDRYAASLVWDGFAPNGGNAKSMRVTATVYDGNAPMQENITWEAATTDTDGIVTAADGTFTASGNGEGDVYYRAKATVNGKTLTSALLKVGVTATRGTLEAQNDYMAFAVGNIKTVDDADYSGANMSLGNITVSAPTGGAIQVQQNKLSYRSTDATVATVDASGNVTAIKNCVPHFGDSKECDIEVKYKAAWYTAAHVTVTNFDGYVAITSLDDIDTLSGSSDPQEFDRAHATDAHLNYVNDWGSDTERPKYVLTQDIDLNGRSGAFGNDMYATLDGNGHSIANGILYAQPATWGEGSLSGKTAVFQEFFGELRNIAFTGWKILSAPGKNLTENKREWFPVSLVQVAHPLSRIENVYLEIDEWTVDGLASSKSGGALNLVSSGTLVAAMNTEHSTILPEIYNCIVDVTPSRAFTNHVGTIFGHAYGSYSDCYAIVRGTVGVREIPSIASGWGTADYGADPYAHNYASAAAVRLANKSAFNEGGVFATPFWERIFDGLE